MATFLRTNYVFGPIFSRRLGRSLGVNILPANRKICNYNCVYCECGWNEAETGSQFPAREIIHEQLRSKLQKMQDNKEEFDVITFSGNGEPTLHPNFSEIIDDTVNLRNIFYPDNKICVLTNATNLYDDRVFATLNRIENPILKIDSAIDETMRKINLPISKNITTESIISGMMRFCGNFIMQIMFLRGENNGVLFDNTTSAEVTALIEVMKKTRPRQVMIYTIDREPSAQKLIKISPDELQAIGKVISSFGFNIFITP